MVLIANLVPFLDLGDVLALRLVDKAAKATVECFTYGLIKASLQSGDKAMRCLITIHLPLTVRFKSFAPGFPSLYDADTVERVTAEMKQLGGVVKKLGLTGKDAVRLFFNERGRLRLPPFVVGYAMGCGGSISADWLFYAENHLYVHGCLDDVKNALKRGEIHAKRQQ